MKNFKANAQLFTSGIIPAIKILINAPKTSPLAKISLFKFMNWAMTFLPLKTNFKFEEKNIQEFYIKNQSTICDLRILLTINLINEISNNTQNGSLL